MVRRHLIGVAIVFAVTAFAVAAEPPHYRYAPSPPGTVVQSVLFYPAGEGMQSQWRAVASREHLGASAYQWYLSIYSIDYDTATYHLRYQSPNAPPVERVKRYSGLWLPLESVHIVGVTELRQPGVTDLVVQSHEASADCGGAEISIFIYDAAQRRIRRAASVSNGCALSATILHAHSGDMVELAGPYYAQGAPLCCPTKVRAVAYLRYRAGGWVETPRYFALALR